jgi:hypothetical protein
MDLTTALAFSTSIASVVIRSGDELGRRYSMFEMLMRDTLQESATAPTTVADKRGLLQHIVSDVYQSQILCFL